jgi:outer membrane receptor protein involved in Fe transport
VGVDWTVGRFADSTVNLHVDTAAQSRSYFTVPNTETVSDSGHELTSLQLSYETPEWRFSLWSQNLFDSHYIVAGYNDLSSLGQNVLNRGLPRAFGFRVRRSF